MDRYHQTDVMNPAPGNGSWVLWTDHCASLADAQTEIARLRGALEEIARGEYQSVATAAAIAKETLGS